MNLRRFAAVVSLALLVPVFAILPSCSSAACADGGEGCPCDEATPCGEAVDCRGWLCDGTCHRIYNQAGSFCLMETCAGSDVCLGVCDGAGTCIGCLQDADCGPGRTCEPGNVCSRCDDGIKNGDEKDVDCGGSCPLCPGTCNVDADCPGGYCWEGLCARCDDGIKNGNEFDVDCSMFHDGGHCPICYGPACMDDAQCASGACELGTCCKTSCPVCYDCSQKTGECFPLGAGVSDTVVGGSPDVLCVDNYMCDGKGKCGLRPDEPCTQDAECAAGQCINGICQ